MTLIIDLQGTLGLICLLGTLLKNLQVKLDSTIMLGSMVTSL